MPRPRIYPAAFRRLPLFAAAIAVSIAASRADAAGRRATGAPAPPNIVLIVADDLGYHSLGATGQKLIQTPHLDRLARSGMMLTNFYATHLCSPSRGCLMTGLSLARATIRGNHELGGYADDAEFGQMPLPTHTQTLGTTLHAAGYTTALIGKWGLGGPGSPGVPTRQGFDFFYGYLDQKQAQNYYPRHLWRNETREPLDNPAFHHHQRFPDDKDPHDPANYAAYQGRTYACDPMTVEAERFIRAPRTRPFFLEMAYPLPHMALQVPEDARRAYEGKFEETPYLGTRKAGYTPNRTPRATYAAMISLLDAYVGRLLAALDESGLTRNTLVIFTADNGAAVAGGCPADFFGCSGALRGRKGSLYEGGLKVPFIAAWPGVIAPGSSSDHVAAIWDVMPTLLEAAGAAVPRDLDGVSFLPTLQGRATAQPRHEYLYWESHPFRVGGEDGAQAVRFGPWKAVRIDVHRREAQPSIELYNLDADPAEKNDLAARHPELVRRAADYMSRRQLGIIPEWNYYRPALATEAPRS